MSDSYRISSYLENILKAMKLSLSFYYCNIIDRYKAYINIDILLSIWLFIMEESSF